MAVAEFGYAFELGTSRCHPRQSASELATKLISPLHATLEKGEPQSYSTGVAMTLDQIVEETRSWPREQLGELLDRLTLELHQADDPEVENAWRQEIRRHLAEIENGQVEGIPGEEVSARVRRIVGR